MDQTFVSEQFLPPFIFNIDETGFIDFIDRRDEIVVFLIDVIDGTVKGAEMNSSNSKRATMIGGIASDRSILIPCIVLSNKRCEKN